MSIFNLSLGILSKRTFSTNSIIFVKSAPSCISLVRVFPSLVSFFITILVSICIAVMVADLINNIGEFRYFLKQRKEARIVGLTICPKCKGIGWLDWVEQIVGRRG